jgi:hypothetical protein
MEIEERLNHLEEVIREQTSAKLMTAATLEALQQGLQEACAQLGVSEEQFLPRFQATARWYYDRLLGKASDAAPNLAGEIDTRTNRSNSNRRTSSTHISRRSSLIDL